MKKAKPFVKWAGGKRQLLTELKKYIPKSFDCYYEPFVGGGALLFELSPKKAVINDFNEELINVYQVLCDEIKYLKMCQILNLYEKKHSEEFYYKIRNKDRDKFKYSKLNDYVKAARTIYLNKSCFNGLYRVNSQNKFNVPFNKKIKVNTYNPDNLLNVHLYLTMNNIVVLNDDFEKSVEKAKAGDFVYFDPPYDTDTDSFTSYTNKGFGKKEQKRLFNVYHTLDKKGVKVMLSNHNTTYINELYKDYNIKVVKAKRNINANGKGRGLVEETIITNY